MVRNLKIWPQPPSIKSLELLIGFRFLYIKKIILIRYNTREQSLIGKILN